MVPEKERLAIEMGAKRLRVDVQKAARCGRLAGGRAVQETHFRVIYGLHVFASVISADFRASWDPERQRRNAQALPGTPSESDESSAEAAAPRSPDRPAPRRRRSGS